MIEKVFSGLLWLWGEMLSVPLLALPLGVFFVAGCFAAVWSLFRHG